MGCKCSIFKKRYSSIEDVQLELRHKGIDDIILTLGIDYTKSNRFSGKKTFNGKNLHTIDEIQDNPYQQILKLLTKTLEPMLSYNSIYMLGFSDVYTQNNCVFTLNYRNNSNLTLLENSALNLSDQVLDLYKKITPKVTLSGPSTLIPLIESSINIYLEKKKEQILIIITNNDFNKEELDKLLEASIYPISIICIGVGDKQFTNFENIKENNFQFADFNKVLLIENEGEKVHKIFEKLPEIFNRQKIYLGEDYKKIPNFECIKPIPAYYS